MAEAYREGALRCPACVGLLEPRDADGTIVDVCPACAGLWIDWFDGDPSTLAREIAPLDPAPAPVDAASGAACPRCNHGLVEERYAGSGPRVLRCGDCAGAFVPRASYDELAALAPPVDRGADSPEPSTLTRLVAALRRWLAAPG